MPKTRGSHASGLWGRLIAGLRHVLEKTLLWGERLPRGVRSVLGVLAMIAGVLGFLPILGFWMFPLGFALLSLDVPPLRRWLHVRLADPAAVARHTAKLASRSRSTAQASATLPVHHP